MGFFNFTKPANNSADENSRKPVILQLNEEEIRISADEAAGKTVRDLFEMHANQLGDVKNITRFVSAGQIINEDTPIVLGTIYRGAITSETKGNY